MIFRRRLPIVVGGCHRSGTSLVRRILNSHPHIFCGPEVKFFRDYFGHYREDCLAHIRFSYTARTIIDDETLLREWGAMYLRLLRAARGREGKRRWADKNPENTLYLKQWEELLGRRWLYLHVVRNPLDVLASIDEADFSLTIPDDWPGRIEHVKAYMETGLDYVDAHPDRACCIVYEDLVSAPQQTVAAVMKFLGERSAPEQLDFSRCRHGAGMEDPKVSKTTEIHASSVGRWKDRLPPAVVEQARAVLDPVWQRIVPTNRIPAE